MVRLIPSRLSSHLSSRNAPSTSASRAQSPTRTTGPSGSPTENKALFLRTRVIKGRNLAAKDRGGTSDPYLVVTLGASRQSTSAVSKTLNPEWNTTFDLPVSGVPLLEAVCWDKDRFGKDYLGELEIDLADLFPQDTTPQVVSTVPQISYENCIDLLAATLVQPAVKAKKHQEKCHRFWRCSDRVLSL